jgi:hypothetical protein
MEFKQQEMRIEMKEMVERVRLEMKERDEKMRLEMKERDEKLGNTTRLYFLVTTLVSIASAVIAYNKP